MFKNKTFGKAFTATFYEYLLIVLPVSIYVCLEALHYKNYYFIKSPEWSIATIFLCFQTVSLYRMELKKTGKPISEIIFGIFYLVAIVITIIASINSYMSLDAEGNSILCIVIRLALFLLSTISFFTLVTAAKMAT